MSLHSSERELPNPGPNLAAALAMTSASKVRVKPLLAFLVQDLFAAWLEQHL